MNLHNNAQQCSHAWAISSFHQQTLAIATVCFRLDVIPKVSANFRIEWNVILTGYHHPKQVWSPNHLMETVPSLLHAHYPFTQSEHTVLFDTWYLDMQAHAVTPQSLFWKRHPTPESYNPAIPSRWERRGQAGGCKAFHDWKTHDPQGINKHS